jgi:uncharacterized protein
VRILALVVGFGLVALGATDPDGSTALHSAAYNDDLVAARTAIERGVAVNAANRYGMTALSLACTNGSARMVRLLLEAGADANNALPGGETVLMTASRSGNADVVRLLLAHGAKVDAREDRHGQTALMWAAAEGNVEVVKALIAAGADIHDRLASGFTPLLFAVREGKPGVVTALLDAGLDVNEPVPAPAAGVKRPRGSPAIGSTALHIAVANAHFELAAMLLERGANPNAAGPGYTPLHILPSIRKSGGGDNDPSPEGSGAMSSLEFLKAMKAKGANLNARMTRKVAFGLTALNTNGATPFLLAARTADAELMRALAALGADPNIPNADGANAMIVAAGLGTRSPGEDAGTEAEVVEALQAALDLGVDINAVDQNGETAMHGAAYKNLPGAVEFLASHGAKIDIWNRRDKYGWTPLIIAEGYRFGNYKPSPETVAAFRKIMVAAGVWDTRETHAQSISEYK